MSFLDGSPVLINVDGFTFNAEDEDGLKWTIDDIDGWTDGPSTFVEQNQRIVSHGQFGQAGRRGGRQIMWSGRVTAPGNDHGLLVSAAERLATILADGQFKPLELIDANLGSRWAPVQLLETPDLSLNTDDLSLAYQITVLAPSAYKYGLESSASTALSADVTPDVLASDAFTRADSAVSLGSPDVGSAWIAELGTWGISSNRAQLVTGAASDWVAAVIECGVADVTVEVTLPVLGPNGFTGLKIRSAGDNSGFAVFTTRMYDANTVNTAVGGVFSETFVAGDRMRVTTSGTTITVYRQAGAAGGWSQVMTTTSSLYQTNTKHGIASWSTTETASRWDDFTVTGTGTGLVFPLFAPDGELDFGALTDVGQAAVTNFGTAPAPVVFTVTGPTPTAGFVITDTTTGDRIQYLGQVPDGSTLVINSGDGTVLIDGTADRLGDTIVDAWPTVPAGQTRAFLFDPNGSATASTLTATVVSTYW